MIQPALNCYARRNLPTLLSLGTIIHSKGLLPPPVDCVQYDRASL